jgi:hypothetical protein
VLGYIPVVAFVINLAAASTEDAILIWLADLAHEVQIGAAGAFSYDTSGHLSAYSTVSIDSGTSNDDDDPVRLTGGLGLTIGANFSDDGDEIVVIAFPPHGSSDRDLGDINA